PILYPGANCPGPARLVCSTPEVACVGRAEQWSGKGKSRRVLLGTMCAAPAGVMNGGPGGGGNRRGARGPPPPPPPPRVPDLPRPGDGSGVARPQRHGQRDGGDGGGAPPRVRAAVP